MRQNSKVQDVLLAFLTAVQRWAPLSTFLPSPAPLSLQMDMPVV